MKRWTYRLTLTSRTTPMPTNPIVIENVKARYLRKSSATAHALKALGALMEVGYAGTYEVIPTSQMQWHARGTR